MSLFQLRAKHNSKLCFWVCISTIVITFLIVRHGYPVLVIPYAAHDDALFVRLSESIIGGQWLGNYNNTTLVKGPLLSILGAVGGIIEVWAQSLESILYITAIMVFAILSNKINVSFRLTFLLVFLLCANPQVWSISGSRFVREILYTSLTMMLFAFVVLMGLQRRSSQSSFGLALAAGLTAGAAYLTREEDIWLLGIIIVICALILLFGAMRRVDYTSIPCLRSVLIAFGGITLGGALTVGPIVLLNQSHYGRPIVSEFRAPEFREAIGALMRVGDRHPSGFVYATHHAMAQVFETSPAAATVKLHWPQIVQNWSIHGAYLDTEGDGEFYGAWFVWAFRDAAASAGHHQTAQDALRFYKQLALEVNASCDSGKLVCRDRRDTLAPELPLERIPELISVSLSALVHTTFLSSEAIAAPRSTGEAVALQRWAELIGPVVVASTQVKTISGWIAHQTEEPMLGPLSGTSVRIHELSAHPGTDVVSVLAAQGKVGVQASRFRLAVECISDVCAIGVTNSKGEQGVIQLDAPTSGPLEVDAPFWGHIDSVLGIASTYSPAPLEGFRQAIISAAVTGARFLVPLLCITSTLGLLVFPFVWRREDRSDFLVIVAIGAAAAVLGRCLIIAYIDITSWRAINAVYLGPAYPFVILYSIVGTEVLFKCLRPVIASNGHGGTLLNK